MRFLNYQYMGLFLGFFILSLGLGYATLNRYDPVAFDGLSDLVFYADIVRNGPVFFIDEPLSIRTRLLSPWVAHLFYIMLPSLGSWNTVSVALLIGNSIFTALSVVLIFDITYHFFRDSNIALISGFLFITNFTVINLNLAGGVDAAYGFFFLVLYYALINDKWTLLPVIMVLGCLTKEAFLPVASAFILFSLIYQMLSLGRLSVTKVVLFLVMVSTGAATIITLNFLVYGTISLPWAMLSSANIYIEPSVFDFGVFAISVCVELLRFLLTLGLLVFLSLSSIRKFPQWFLAGNFGTVLMIVSLGTYMTMRGVDLSGADYARFIFSPAALFLCSASAVTISKLQMNFSKRN